MTRLKNTILIPINLCQQNYDMSKKDIKVPNIGEFKNVEIIEILIKKDQEIRKNDPLITIESDKSSVEIPSTDDGKVNQVYINVGDKVSEGDKILEIEVNENLIEKKKDNLLLKEDSIKEKEKKIVRDVLTQSIKSFTALSDILSSPFP